METKTLLTKFAAFMRDHLDHGSKDKAEDAEIVDEFLVTLPSDGDPSCTHCGSQEVVEEDLKNRPGAAPGERGPAYKCVCGYWTHRKVAEPASGWR